MRQPGARFDGFKLAASRQHREGSVDPETLPRVADRVAEPGGRIDWSIRGGFDEAGRPALTVTIAGTVRLTCQRCLGTLSQRVEQSTVLLLARDETQLVMLDEASEREVVLAGAPLDALALVEDELLLTLPFAPRHEHDCVTVGPLDGLAARG